MDMVALARRMVPMAMNIAGSARKTATLKLKTGSTYDYVTDTTTTTSTDATVQGIQYRSAQQQKNDITGNECSLLVEIDKLPVSIKEVDTVVIDGETWQIVRPEFDPTNTIAVLILRR